jgi:ABC-type branched-subunit amino acid transport system substrate-binding protein
MILQKHIVRVLIIALIIPFGIATAQDKKSNYGNTPDEIFPYSKYEKAYKYHFLIPLYFYGAGRDIKAPKDLTEVRIGFLGPLTGSIMVPQGLQMLNGATLSIEEANKKGGYHGLPYKLLPHNDAGQWGAAANEVVKMDDEKVWAFLGSIDDIVSHVALRAALKMEIPIMNTGDPDPTYTETNIPWTIRVITDDRQSCYALVNHIYKQKGHSRIAVLRANNRYGRVGILQFTLASVRVGHPVIIEERFIDGETNFKEQLEHIIKTSPDGLVVWANAKESALILKQAREMGMKQDVFFSDRIVSPEFLKIAGKFADGVVSTCQYNPNSDNTGLKEFKSNYLKRFGIEADVFAVHAYDGMNILLAAIQKVGLNRVLIRDVLTDLKTFQGYEGISGKKVFDATWNDVSPIWMNEVRNGKFVFTPAPPMDMKDKTSMGTGNY